MKRIISTIFILSAFAFVSNAQSNDASDSNLGLSYDPSEIVEEWKAWKDEETTENAYIGTFMDDYEVPTTPINKHLTLKESWYYWISLHPDEVEAYIELKEENEE